MNYPLTHPWFEAHFFNEAKSDGSYMSHDPFEGKNAIPLSLAQGLLLWCPCGIDQKDVDGNLRYPLDLSLNKGRPHGCMIVFRNPLSGVIAPDNFGPTSRGDKNIHPRWTIVSGDSLSNLTLDPSIAVGNPECWHGWIKNGVVS